MLEWPDVLAEVQSDLNPTSNHETLVVARDHDRGRDPDRLLERTS